METTKITSNGETCHEANTNETNETETHSLSKGNTSPEASKSDSGHETSDTQTDDAIVDPTQNSTTAELPDKGHSHIPVKNQI